MGDDAKSRQLDEAEFSSLWHSTFQDLARDANNEDAYTARRFILQARLGEAEIQMVRWTRWAVVVALVGITASLILGVLQIFFG